jgi:hypothetical protein
MLGFGTPVPALAKLDDVALDSVLYTYPRVTLEEPHNIWLGCIIVTRARNFGTTLLDGFILMVFNSLYTSKSLFFLRMCISFAPPVQFTW